MIGNTTIYHEKVVVIMFIFSVKIVILRKIYEKFINN